MIINHNLNAMNAHRQMGINLGNTGKATEKLSSGLRINRAGDDAAGLAISEKMRAQVRGLNQASRNAQDGISLIQTAEGALTESHAILQRMRELAVQSANDTNVAVDRGEIQKEIDQLSQELTRIADTTQFNTQNLLDGDLNVKFHIGANEGQDVALEVSAMDAKSLDVQGKVYKAQDLTGTKLEVTSLDGKEVKINFKGIVSDKSGPKEEAKFDKDTNTITITLGQNKADDKITTTNDSLAELIKGTDANVTVKVKEEGTVALTGKPGDFTSAAWELDAEASKSKGINVSSQENASKAITTINGAIEKVSAERSMLGAMQNRLEHTIANLDTSSENLQASESRIRDVDMAKEMMNFSKNNILQQAAQAMLAQANNAPQGILQLLR